ncbi:MAG: glycerophosphodiester phosphodiesterase [Planctomycetaceae bacterium]
MVERSFSQEGFPLVVAHRGASAERPENTLASFERAIEVGADAVEFDVRITADGHAVVLHDPAVERTTDGAGLVGDLTLEQVRALRVGGSDERVPTLEEALRCCSGRIAVDVEIKNLPGEPDFEPARERAVDALFAALEAVAFEGAVLVSSFNPASIAHARRAQLGVATGLLTALSVRAPEALAAATAGGHPWVLPFVVMVREAGDGYPARVHGAGIRLGTWIVDDPVDAVALLGAGVDAVATNDPAAIVAARREAFG